MDCSEHFALQRAILDHSKNPLVKRRVIGDMFYGA